VTPAGELAARAAARITTGPYTLRPWVPSDVAWIYDACQDREIQRFIPVPRPYRAADAVAFLQQSIARRADGSAYCFAITATDTDELMGSIAVRPGDGPMGNVGYWVAALARGHGVASTALDGLARWSFDGLGLATVWLEVAATNLASRRVAERAGFTRAGRPTSGCPDGDEVVASLVYERRRES
jgi:RimJ/RimL family protein N-acetyltransferase